MLNKNYLFILLLTINVVFSQNNNCFDIARKGSLSEMEMLFQKDKTIVNAIDDRGSSMLILACYRGNKEVAHFLIDKFADLNYVSPNGTALMASVVKNEFDFAEKLLKKGANPDLTDGNGMTALMLAVQFKNAAMVKLLLSFNAKKELKCKQNKTAFEYAVFSTNEEIINLLK